MSDEFKKCPEGHVYDSEYEDCPYCSGENIDDELEKLPPDEKRFPPEVAMCYDMGPGFHDGLDDEF